MCNRRASVTFIEQSYQLYEQKMYQIAYRILHDSQLAEDAVQEAFLKLIRNNIYFENPESDDCKRYLITVVKNASINIYNRKKREQEIMYLSDQDIDVKDILGQDEIEEYADIKELISELPSKYYAVIQCLVVENLSVRETAKELRITEANVRKRFQRAKTMIRKLMRGGSQHEYKYQKGNGTEGLRTSRHYG